MAQQLAEQGAAKRILIAEDDDNIRNLLGSYLSVNGYDIDAVDDGSAALDRLSRGEYDMAVLDIMLPGVDGLELCRTVRERHHMPVLLLTALGEEPDRIEGFRAGADDYVVKPFSPRELVARVQAILRRSDSAWPGPVGRSARPSRPAVADDHPLRVDTACKSVTYKGRELELTPSEFKILAALAARKGVVYSRDELLDLLYPAGEAVVHKTVDFHVHNIRAKLGVEGAALLETVRGFGYRIRKA
jgi:DNA-binding response OmpR family regulator